jgi:hypothetical protein
VEDTNLKLKLPRTLARTHHILVAMVLLNYLGHGATGRQILRKLKMKMKMCFIWDYCILILKDGGVRVSAFMPLSWLA